MAKKLTSILLTLLSVQLFAALYVPASPETDHIDKEIALIQAEFNVQVHYLYDTNVYFPKEWMEPSLDLNAGEMDVVEVTRLLPLIRTFLTQHPTELVRNELEGIYLLKALSFRGKAYGSTHADKGMYIVSTGITDRYSDEFMLCRLHSEFSSILLEHHVFPADRWNQIHPDGFVYSGTGFEMVDNPSCYDSTDRSCSDGFLVNYCRSSMQNDFNIVSSWLFTKKDKLDALSQKYPKIRQKQVLAEQFYQSLSTKYVFN